MAVPATKIDLATELLARRTEPGGEAGWAATARTSARRRFASMGAPQRRDEYWKYTDPAMLVAPHAPETALSEDDAAGFGTSDHLRVVFVDGVYDASQSDDLTSAGLEVHPLQAALETDIHWARDIFGHLEAQGQVPVDRPLAALNTALAIDGTAIRVTGRAERPVSLIYQRRDPFADIMVRHVIKLEKDADFTLLETGSAAARCNMVMEVDVADDASFHHVRVQGRDHGRRAFTAMFARLGVASSLKSFTLTVNGRLTRNEYVVDLAGDGARAHVAGCCAGNGAFHHDDTVFVTHGAADGQSRQVFKKVLRDGSVGVFQGKILVKPGAQRTDGYQISQALLLDEESQFLAKPELEIYADDVKCSHGSTCGAVDETALFYLTSRGVPRSEAQDLLVLAFLDEAILEIEDERLADDVRARLGAWLARRRT